ncbi:hypothetical protein ACFLZV_07265, partial [Candidatus Margulisiibacteriota bacterium]
GLVVNIKTESINVKNRKLTQQLEKLKEKNTKLNIKILKASSLVEVERIASEKLLMSPPQKINYLVIE